MNTKAAMVTVVTISTTCWTTVRLLAGFVQDTYVSNIFDSICDLFLTSDQQIVFVLVVPSCKHVWNQGCRKMIKVRGVENVHRRCKLPFGQGGHTFPGIFNRNKLA